MGMFSDWNEKRKGNVVENLLGNTPIGQALDIGQPDDPVPPPLVVPPVTRMPTKGDTSKTKRLSLLEQRRRRGRASTILTDSNSDTLG
jgi:hypothetical protein